MDIVIVLIVISMYGIIQIALYNCFNTMKEKNEVIFKNWNRLIKTVYVLSHKMEYERNRKN